MRHRALILFAVATLHVARSHAPWFHRTLILFTLSALVAAVGASCRSMQPQGPKPPLVFAAQPPLDVAIATVNASSARVRTLQADSAQLSTPGLPTMRANLVLERPRRFRMKAEVSALTGPELDLGSNEDVFWMWVKRNRPPAVLFARHDQFQRSAARAMLPIEPDWVIEALGLVYLDPAHHHEGPTARPDGNLEIRSRIPTSDGEMVKVLVLDRQYAWIVEQNIYDVRGQLLAKAKASKHRWYPAEQVSLPGKVDITLPSAQMAFTIDVGSYAINRLAGDPTQLWSVPEISGYPPIDIADSSFQPPGLDASPAAQPTYPTTDYPPRYRGYNQGR